MGGKSKSSSSSSTNNTQVTQSADGVVTGDVFNLTAGTSLNFNRIDEFPEAVAEIMGQLIDLTGETIDSAGNIVENVFNKALDTLNKNTETAINTAVQTSQQAAQPDLELLKNQTQFIPYLLIGVLVIGAVAIWRK